jgi:peroxiredoxin
MPLTLGEPAPDFSLKDMNGHRVALHEFRGRKVVLYMWASW